MKIEDLKPALFQSRLKIHHLSLIFKGRFVSDPLLQKRVEERKGISFTLNPFHQIVIDTHLLQEGSQSLSTHFLPCALDDHLALPDGPIHEIAVKGLFVLNIDLILPLGDFEERRLSNVEMSPFVNLWHMAIEKGEE